MLVTSDPSLSALNSGFCWLLWLFPCSLNFWSFWVTSVLLPAQRVQWGSSGWVEKMLRLQREERAAGYLTCQQTKCRWKNWVVSASAESWKTLGILQAKSGEAELVSLQNKIGKHRGKSSRNWRLTSPKATKQIAAREFGFVKDCARLWELSLL